MKLTLKISLKSLQHIHFLVNENLINSYVVWKLLY